MTETPRPDPWAQVRTFDVSTYGDCRMERDYYGDITSEQTHQRGEYAWVDEVDAARAADVARHKQEVARYREMWGCLSCGEQHAVDVMCPPHEMRTTGVEGFKSTIRQQAETIRQLQATLPELHDAIERQSAQIAALTQERDEEARAFKRAAKDRDICRQKRVDLEAHCATLTAALEQKEATEKREREKLHLEWSDRGGDWHPDEFYRAVLFCALDHCYDRTSNGVPCGMPAVYEAAFEPVVASHLGAVEPGWENKTVNMTNDQYSAFEAALLATQQSVCAALAAAPQGGKP